MCVDTVRYHWVRVTDPEALATRAILPGETERTRTEEVVPGRTTTRPDVVPTRPRIIFGRYVMLRKIGEGGSGIVYTAYDPELDRKVALKLLHAGEGSSTGSNRPHARLLREAQAMARLSHPNVISVYDVGSCEGEMDDAGPTTVSDEDGTGVYVVMELVRGKSLDQWMKQERRHWKTVLDVFLQAARGLAEAHDQGLIHRDFKPSNVMVGEDGRVRVLDFGLARVLGGADPGSSQIRRRSSESLTSMEVTPNEPVLDTPLTQDGTVMGTPAYMAPEQHRGEEADARADQYAFCVALYEALHGQRPFGGRDIHQLHVAKEALRFQAGQSDAPKWLLEVVDRGLRVEPDERFPSMQAVIDQLEMARPERRVNWLATAMSVFGLSGLMYAGLSWASEERDVCAEQAVPTEGIWDRGVKAGIRAAFRATEVGYAETAWQEVESRLDHHVQAIQDVRTASCRAALVDESQAVSAMGVQLRCLDRQLARIAGLTRSFQLADEAVVKGAVEAVSALPDPLTCSTLGHEQTGLWNEDTRQRIQAFEGRVADVAASLRAARVAEAVSMSGELVDEARRNGDADMLAHALLQRANALAATGRDKDAQATWSEAIVTAERAGDDETAIRALQRLAKNMGFVGSNRDETVRLIDLAMAKAERLQGQETLLAGLMYTRAAVEQGPEREALTREKMEEALAMANRATVPDPLLISRIRTSLGVALDRTGNYEAAMEHYQWAYEIRKERLGAEHQLTAGALGNVAAMNGNLGNIELAESQLRQVVRTLRKSVGDTHWHVAWYLNTHAWALSLLERPRESVLAQLESLAAFNQSLGVEHKYFARFVASAANNMITHGSPDAGLEILDAAIATRRSDPEFATSRHLVFPRARGLRMAGRPGEALPIIRATLKDTEAETGPTHVDVKDVLSEEGEILLALGRPEDARVPLARAVRICEVMQATKLVCVDTWAAYAKSLGQSDPDLTRTLMRNAIAENEREGVFLTETAKWRTWLESFEQELAATEDPADPDRRSGSGSAP